MDTGRLKRFAQEARNILMTGIAHRVSALGIDEEGNTDQIPVLMDGGCVFMGEIMPIDFYYKWKSLQDNIIKRKAKQVVEEAAYTWFNRLVAIRIMVKNGIISPVLEYASASARIPIIVAEARKGRMPDMDAASRAKLLTLLENDALTTEQFSVLIVAFCHANPMLDACFGRITDYTELLLPNDILTEGGFIGMLNHTEFITDEDFRSPELIGWLYQFYISERKDEVFAKKGKFEADEIPAATQIFTPNWIVKYMVQNTIGRIYLDNNPSATSEFKPKWKYLVEQSAPTPKETIYKFKELTELLTGDLACGSGHILNECFDLFYDLYIYEGYSRREAIENIFKYNLRGVDLDTRAKQLATFALMLKACQKDASFADAHILPYVLTMPAPVPEERVSECFREFFQETPSYQIHNDLIGAFELMQDADSLGSIMKFDLAESTLLAISQTLDYWHSQSIIPELVEEIMPAMDLILTLTDHYTALVMNPPYMGNGNMNEILSNYVKRNYEDGKADLFSTFMILAINRLADNGKYGMINMHSWMFLSSFDNLRRSLVDNYHIDSLLHLGPRTFDELSGEVVQNAAFVISKAMEQHINDPESCNSTGTFYRLVEGRNCADKERLFLDAKTVSGIYYPKVEQKNFKKIPSCPIGYWLSDNIIHAFDYPNFSAIGEPRSGIMTGNSPLYVKLFFEVSKHKIGFGLKDSKEIVISQKKWFPIVAGGSARKWYGNLDSVVNLENDGADIKANVKNYRLREPKYYFRESITWPKICSGSPTFRLCPQGVLFGDSGLNMFVNDKLNIYIGLLNSKVATHILKVINPTFNNQVSDIGNIPIPSSIPEESELITTNITISKNDWDAHETSWNFEANPLVALRNENVAKGNLEASFRLSDFVEEFETQWTERFMQLHQNEEELNRQFISIYGLEDELTPDVPLDEITILQQGEIGIVNNGLEWHEDVLMKQLISYAVGCMMGRYSLDKAGLILANQGDGLKEFKQLAPNSTFEIDDDGIIPLMPVWTSFTDNATHRFKEWLLVAFGEETLVENLNYIEASLGKSIDDYFVKDFWKDHKKMYQSRPIYWLFSSAKGAFQCLAYMHRMDAFTPERIRTKYLLPHMEWLRQQYNDLESRSATLTTNERRKMDNLARQIQECQEYHDILHVVADDHDNLAFDLDDGVVVNYAKFAKVLAKLK